MHVEKIVYHSGKQVQVSYKFCQIFSLRNKEPDSHHIAQDNILIFIRPGARS